MKLNKLKDLVLDDFQDVDRLICSNISSDVPLINSISHYLFSAGGKRLRPLVVLLCSRACGYLRGNHQIPMAVAIEFIHTATLLHDDVVDASSMRRGKQTASHLWGNEAAILVGDFLYSRAFQLMLKAGDIEMLQVISNATNMIAEGEILQLAHQYDPATTESKYLKVIQHKTAKLFEAAAELSAVLANVDNYLRKEVAKYGAHLGTAYQLMDDILDYQGSTKKLGKNVGNDLSEGKPTLPLIYLVQHGSAAEKKLATSAILQGGSDKLNEIKDMLANSKAIQYTLTLAQREATLAKESILLLPSSPYRDAAVALADFVVSQPL